MAQSAVDLGYLSPEQAAAIENGPDSGERVELCSVNNWDIDD